MAEKPVFGETASVKEVVAQGVLDRRCPDIRQSPAGDRRQSMRELRDAEAAKLHESLAPVLPLSLR
ncbi:hypothetical protein [Bradyrhizobium sp. i1.15.2]|uniref:hypothetical protein n=1 Tax=Bradyrhizobium sp. i1.15.2 TaxID=3156362 RepID=UPI0033937F1F